MDRSCTLLIVLFGQKIISFMITTFVFVFCVRKIAILGPKFDKMSYRSKTLSAATLRISILLVKERQPYDWVVLSPAKAGSSLRLTLPKGVLARGGPVDVARQGGKPSEVARPEPEQVHR